jgi:methionyl aminopeptidase
MPPGVLECLREAGRIAAAARDHGARLVVPGASLREVCEAIEDDIRRRGGEPAFPAQTSRNHVAAHYCPSPEDGTIYAEGDLAKLDVGVHVDGYVVDTALTVNVGDRPENRGLVEATRAALEAAISVARAGIAVDHISSTIEKTVRAYGLRPLQNLCGHGVGRWTVHCAPPIPNMPQNSSDRLGDDAVVAIEPFATAGRGNVTEVGPAEVFRLDPVWRDGSDLDADVMGALRKLQGLPFARRTLAGFPRAVVEQTLGELTRRGALRSYAPLVETSGKSVAQSEHTVYVGPGGAEVLTR